ncbi:protein ARV1-like [Rhopilema esculentum]|uniref:protein ARV1-like n=1 Tax=Rhopilema esculentum TaxID=499914 RepID=UPI0031DE7E78
MDVTSANPKPKTFICVECGSYSALKFKKYPSGAIKLYQCVTCGDVVDKYIEYDSVMVLLDILLHNSKAYRHVLFNVEVKVLRQLLVLSILCDTYMRWAAFHQFCFDDSSLSNNWHLVLELQFYKMLGISSLELCINICVTSVIVSFANRKKMSFSESFQSIPKSLLMSSYGKLLALAALVWNPDNSYWYLVLTKMFVITSNAEAIKVISHRTIAESVAYVACGVLAGFLVQDYLLSTKLADWQFTKPA